MKLHEAIDGLLTARLNLENARETLSTINETLDGSFCQSTNLPLDIEAQLKVAAGAAAAKLVPAIELLAEATSLSGADPTEKIELGPVEEAELAAAVAEERD